MALAFGSVQNLPLPLGHNATSIVVTQGKILNFGGETNNNVLQTACLQYDPVSNAWTTISSLALPSARKSPITVLIGNLLISCCGGDPNPSSGVGWSMLLP